MTETPQDENTVTLNRALATSYVDLLMYGIPNHQRPNAARGLGRVHQHHHEQPAARLDPRRVHCRDHSRGAPHHLRRAPVIAAPGPHLDQLARDLLDDHDLRPLDHGHDDAHDALDVPAVTAS